jgi:hypothetical protein
MASNTLEGLLLAISISGSTSSLSILSCSPALGISMRVPSSHSPRLHVYNTLPSTSPHNMTSPPNYCRWSRVSTNFVPSPVSPSNQQQSNSGLGSQTYATSRLILKPRSDLWTSRCFQLVYYAMSSKSRSAATTHLSISALCAFLERHNIGGSIRWSFTALGVRGQVEDLPRLLISLKIYSLTILTISS